MTKKKHDSDSVTGKGRRMRNSLMNKPTLSAGEGRTGYAHKERRKEKKETPTVNKGPVG